MEKLCFVGSVADIGQNIKNASDRRSVLKIAFWSSAYSHSCVTATMAAVSMAWAFSCEPRIAVTENHWNGFGVREMLGVPWSFCNAQKRSNRYFYGETVYNRAIERLSKEIIFLENKLRYVPIQTEPFFRVLFETVEEAADCPCEQDEVLMIDTAFSSMSTQVILQEADLVAVVLTQEEYGIERFLEEYHSLLPKAVFIIGNYRKTSHWNLDYLEKHYHLPKEKIGMIPWNEEYAQAMREGRTIEFFTRYFNCNRNHVNYNFMKESKKAAAMLCRKVMERS